VIDLLYLARDHDLPPKWDGHYVEWAGWVSLDMFICPPPKREVCKVCGSTELSITNRGIIRDRDGKTGRERRYSLMASRCPDCRTDQVMDWNGAWWDLDPSDYVDDGSRVLR
jgi:RNA polymerase subunit RPABC4/transcription elongation factor Spt4